MDTQQEILDLIQKRIYIDLFAGCGGLSLGLHKAGWKGLFAIERDPMAFETLKSNMMLEDCPYPDFDMWPEWLPRKNMGIEEVLENEETRGHLQHLRGKISLISGGPPCQGFSVGGIRDGKDMRNQLVHQFIELVDLVHPPLVLIENVEGIARRFVSKPGHHDIPVADHIVNLLNLKGYDAHYSIVNAVEYGIPQTRRRVFIVGITNELTTTKPLAKLFASALEYAGYDLLKSLNLPTDRPITVGEAIHDLVGGKLVPWPDSPKFESGKYTRARSKYAKLMRCGITAKTIPDCHRYSKHGERILNLYKLAAETQPPGRLSKQFLLSCGTKKDKKVLIDPEKPASTITTHPDEFIHYAEPRNITLREMARLQSFPDDFHFYGRYTINGPRRRHDMARCSQIGNAVPPLLAQTIGNALIDLVSSVDGSENSKLHYNEDVNDHQLSLFSDQD